MIKLSKLLHSITDLSSLSLNDADIESMTLDARQVSEGGLFVAVQGANVHGLKYLNQAVENGVSHVIYEANDRADELLSSEFIKNISQEIQLVPIHNLSQKVSEIAARFYGYPSDDLTIIAITGTNGKTTCAYLLAQLLESQNKNVALIGTLGSGYLNELFETGLTTPDAISLQRRLAEFLSAGVTHVVMEASSHALAQYRLDAVEVDVAAFTNFSQDHLDYHGSMQEYLQAKLRLFQFASLAAVVVNANEPASKEIVKILNSAIKTSAYKVNNAPSDAANKASDELCELFGEYCLSALDVEYTAHGISLSINNKDNSYRTSARLLGEFNVANLLLSLQVMQALGFELKDMLSSVTALVPPPGRLQKVDVAKTPAVIVDYAHTPDALENALQTLKALEHEDLIAVFGCGGNRDKAKRPLMAEVAERLADIVVLTDDNPRLENSKAIINDVLTGIKDAEKVSIISDRAKAIKESIKNAKLNDIVLIAGKGHEDYQVLGNQKIHFSDYEHAYAALQEWRAAA